MIFHAFAMLSAFIQPTATESALTGTDHNSFAACHGAVDGIYSRARRSRRESATAPSPEQIEMEAELAEITFLIADIDRAMKADENAAWLSPEASRFYDNARKEMEEAENTDKTIAEFADRQFRELSGRCESIVNRLGRKYVADYTKRI